MAYETEGTVPPTEPFQTSYSYKLPTGDALLQTHPEYGVWFHKWEKWCRAYEGCGIEQYLLKHTRESTDIYELRLRRAYYYNYVASVIDLFVSYLFHAPIKRTISGIPSSDLTSFYEDATKDGDSYHITMIQISTLAQVCGHCFVLLDTPYDPDVENEAERKAKKIRPYISVYKPQCVLDWELDDDGKFDFVKIEIQLPSGRTWDEKSSTEKRSFLIYTKTEWVIYTLMPDSKEPKLVRSGVNPLNEVPIVIVRGERSLTHPYMGLSTVREIADINLAIYNWCSLGDEEIFERCLNVLALPSDDSTPDVTLSSHNVLKYPAGSEAPTYLTPGTSPLDLIGSWINLAKDQIYRLAKLGGASSMHGSRETRSGIAYAFEFNETNQSLARKAECLEQAEISIHRLFALWLGVSDPKIQIEYAKEFGVDDFLLELRTLLEAKSTLVSETALKEMEKRLTSKIFARDKQQLRDTINKEIDTSSSIAVGLNESFANVPAAIYGNNTQGDTDDSSPDKKNKDKAKSKE